MHTAVDVHQVKGHKLEQQIRRRLGLVNNSVTTWRELTKVWKALIRAEKFRIIPQCANCGIPVRWYPGVRAWLHVDNRPGASRIAPYGKCQQYTSPKATPQVAVRKGY